MTPETRESLIYIDDLTGLFNRRYLYTQLPKELQLANEQKYNLWLFMLDIDNFKVINDTYGHLSGDEVLKDVATILKENTKSEDKKIRYAGDEFTIILSKVEYEDVMSVAERLLTKINTHRFKDRHSQRDIHLSISIGIAGYPKDASTYLELFDLADKSLYISKQKGKNCISTASEITPEILWKKDVLERFPCPEFVGRKEELSSLKDRLALTITSKGSAFLVSGELGIGKSRLLAEFERIAVTERTLCLYTRCLEKYMAQPFYALAESLDGYLMGLDKLPEGILQHLSDSETQALCVFSPTLKEFTGTTFSKEEKLDETALRDGLVKLLLNLSKIKPLCILLDDVHYIDIKSIEVALRISQIAKENPLLIIFTYEPEELSNLESESPALFNLIKTEVLKVFESINLTGLSEEEVNEIILSILLNFPQDQDFFNLIYRKTKGNPLFVEELLKFLIDKEYIFYQNGNWQQKQIQQERLPSSIEDVIKARIEDLDDEAKEMIAKAAVIGEDFQVDLLQKIDREDRGYILDLMELAKKLGLIYEKGMEGRDEFSFVTSNIRKVLLDLMGGERTKYLYSRVGQIKEKLYPDKLNSIAGELYYNFKKAEDWVRAEQYAKLIKEGKGTVYDRTLKYAEVLLEEAVQEKMILPLSRRTWLFIPEIIRYLYIASINYHLYPPQNQMKTQFIEEVYKRLLDVFSEAEALIIACLETNIIVNNKKLGKELSTFFTGAFISLLRNANVENITFQKGIEKQELVTFVELVSREALKEESISEFFKKQGVNHIKITELVFDLAKRKSKEKESLEEIMLVDYLLGKISFDEKTTDMPSKISSHAQEIAQALEQIGDEVSKKSGKDKEQVKAEIMAKSIQKIGKEFSQKGRENWTRYREGLAKTILAMEPHLRAQILASQPEEKERIDIIKELGLELPDDAIVDILARQYTQKDTDLEKMQRLVERFLSTPKKKDKIVPVLKDKLRQLGASEEECNWIFEKKEIKEIALEERVNKILTLPAQNLFKILPMINLSGIIKELIADNQAGKVEQIMERFFDILEEEPALRQQLVGYFKEILESIIQGASLGLLSKFILRLSNICLKQKEYFPFFFSILNPYLDAIIQILLDTSTFNLVKDIIQLYINAEEKSIHTLELIDLVTVKLVEELTKRIDNNLDWLELGKVLNLVPHTSTKYLIKKGLFEEGVPEGRYFEAYLRRRTIGKILSNMPLGTFLVHLKERLSDQRDYVIRNLIEVIAAIENEEVLTVLQPLLKHPYALVRRKIIFSLSKKKGFPSAKLLAEALMDEDVNVRQEALRHLKHRKDNFAQQLLAEYAQRNDLPEDVREALI